jgi:predicted enzyme related to lactoylglutathione lyase
VDSIVDTLSRVEGRGGKRLLEPQQMPNGPLIALCADPEGHIIGLIQSGTMRAG